MDYPAVLISSIESVFLNMHSFCKVELLSRWVFCSYLSSYWKLLQPTW